MMTENQRKRKGRLRLVLAAAAALGSSSASLSGALVALAVQQPVAQQAASQNGDGIPSAALPDPV